MSRFVQAALAVIAPFVVIAGVFAAALVHHLGEQVRAADRFEAALAVPAAPTAGVADADLVSLTRTPCYGPCPAYRVRIDGAGRVEFVGQAGVCEARPQPVAIDRATAQRLIRGLQRAGFGAVPRVLGVRSDRAGKVVELRIGGDGHRVVDYGAPASDAPLLEAAATAIDRVAGTARWLPRPRPDGAPWCPLPDGRRGVFANGGTRLVPEPATAPPPGPPASSGR